MIFLLGVLALFFICLLIKTEHKLAPSIVFPFVVIVTLFLANLLTIGSNSYRLSYVSYSYVFLGTVSFSFSAYIAENIKLPTIRVVDINKSKVARLYIVLSAFVLLICIIMFYEFYLEVLKYNGFGEYAKIYRKLSVSGEGNLKNELNYLIKNADVLSVPMALIGIYIISLNVNNFKVKLLTGCFVFFSLSIPIITVARSGAIRAVISIFVIYILIYGFRIKYARNFLLMILLVFFIAGFSFGYGSGSYNSFFESLSYFYNSFLIYLAGGYYGLDELLRGEVNVFFQLGFVSSMLAKMDYFISYVSGVDCFFCYSNTYSDFVFFGDKSSFKTNVFTVFGPVYNNLGWLGFLYFVFIGAVLGLLYNLSLRRVYAAIIVLSILYPSIVLLSFSEYFLEQVPTLLRFLFVWVLLSFLSRLRIKSSR